MQRTNSGNHRNAGSKKSEKKGSKGHSKKKPTMNSSKARQTGRRNLEQAYGSNGHETVSSSQLDLVSAELVPNIAQQLPSPYSEYGYADPEATNPFQSERAYATNMDATNYHQGAWEEMQTFDDSLESQLSVSQRQQKAFGTFSTDTNKVSAHPQPPQDNTNSRNAENLYQCQVSDQNLVIQFETMHFL